MRKRYIQIDGVLYERGSEPEIKAPTIIPDIKPYQSMADGTMITSRSHHREHLKRNDCVEIGNDLDVSYKPLPPVSPQKLKDLIVRQVMDLSHDEFKRALKRDADFVKWNSRER